MKLTLSRAIAACTMSLMLVMASCSKKQSSDASGIASTQDVVVMTINAEEMAINAGCQVADNHIVLPEKYQNAITDQDLAKIIDVKGVDLKNLLFCSSYESQVVVATITDRNAFEQWVVDVESTQSVEKGGYTVYAHNGSGWLVKDDMAYFLHVPKNSDPVSVLEARIATAKKSPLSASQIEKLAKDNTINIIINTATMMNLAAETGGANASNNEALTKLLGYDPAVLKDAYSYMEIDFDGDEIDSESQMYTRDGKEIVSNLKMPKIDSALARYCTSAPLFNAVFTMPSDIDWNAALDAIISLYGGYQAAGIPRDALSMITPVLQDIEGTVVFSLSSSLIQMINASTPGVAPKFSDPSETIATLAVQMKPGKAAGYVGQLRSLAVALMGMTPTGTADGFEIMIPEIGAPINVAAIDDTFIVSLGQINTRGRFVGSSSIYDDNAAIAFELPKDTEISQLPKLDFSVLGYMKSDNKESEGELKVSDTNMPVLEAILTYALSK